jgi:hypothetical protein
MISGRHFQSKAIRIVVHQLQDLRREIRDAGDADRLAFGQDVADCFAARFDPRSPFAAASV